MNEVTETQRQKMKEAMRKIVSVVLPFTPRVYKDASPDERIKLLKDFVADLVESRDVDVFTWEDLQKEFEEDPTGFITCSHQVKLWKTVLYYERQVATLRQSMEDLCEEMERVKEGEGRKIILGPGVDPDETL